MTTIVFSISLDFDLGDLDLGLQPLLERPLDEQLRGGGDRLAGGGEDELLQAAAEVRAVDALARAREEDAEDHVAHVVVLGRRSRAPGAGEVVRDVQVARLDRHGSSVQSMATCPT